VFQTVRHWWTGGRGKVTARLFLFEFVVVVLGVLVAQWIAESASRREAVDEMESEKLAYEGTIASAVSIANGWKIAARCLDQRMTKIMRLTTENKPIEGALLERPGLWNFDDASRISDRSFLLLEARYGKPTAWEFGRIANNIERIDQRILAVSDAWSAMAQIDPGNGAPREADRQEVRKAASRIKSALVGLNINADNIIDAGRILGIRADTSSPGQPVANCEEMWRIGVSHRSGNSRRPAYSRESD